MNQRTRRIEAVIYGDDRAVNPLLRAALFGFSLCYGAVVGARSACYRRDLLQRRRLPCKVVSVGNIAVGGTGKTPLTMYVTDILRRMGFSVVVLSRGYKGTAESAGGVVSDGRKLLMDARTAGDEPYMMAMRFIDLHVPVMVGRNRFRTGMAALNRFRPDVVVLDDAFQHLRLARDVDLVLIDGRGFSANRHLLPRGPLREPLSALARSHALIVNRSSDQIQGLPLSALAGLSETRPVFQMRPVSHVARVIPAQTRDAPLPVADLEQLAAKPVFGFCGLAGNRRFKHTLTQSHCDLRGFAGYADHHAYSDHDLKTMLDAARKTRAEYLITTEKDWVRIRHKMPLPMTLVVLGVELDFGADADAFDDFIKEKLTANEQQ